MLLLDFRNAFATVAPDQRMAAFTQSGPLGSGEATTRQKTTRSTARTLKLFVDVQTIW
jgi:hypothetical protein